jgi:Asp-tRNA(Asn)/Glu-tRNA(Gln) amidotransferase A subunit family amidase
VAFWTVPQLAHLIETQQVTSTALTKMYLERLKRYDPILHCVAALTEELALQQAQRADAEIANGHYRGLLHGIPYGAKDLLATKDIRTTWGAEPYQNQVLDYNATVIDRLDGAGAVLLAKLSVGALAWGDVWYSGMTRNPWNLEEGSSGSSAGSASATAAGLVGFSIGTETLGSIVSPAMRCRVTGLRPTFGRVSRHGAMALSWTMDKIGSICRTVEDCAFVFDAIYGPDGKDLTVTDYPFNWDASLDIHTLRIGYVKDAFEADYENKTLDQQSLDVLRTLDIDLIPIKLPEYPIDSLAFILEAEAAAAFDDLTRNNLDDLLTRQEKDAWPNVFRTARFIPAVEYIRAQRIRTLLMRDFAQMMHQVDVVVAPSYSAILLMTNLTGHPAVAVPNGVTEQGNASSITFTGPLYGEAQILAVAKAYQDATEFHVQHPVLTIMSE